MSMCLLLTKTFKTKLVEESFCEKPIMFFSVWFVIFSTVYRLTERVRK